MVPFYINNLGFTLELRSPSNFKTTGLVQPWQTLCKMFSRCLTTRVTGYDQPPLQIMQMLYCFVNNIHVDYADLLWEGFHYSLEHPTTLIPYSRFTKLIVSHYMISFPEISRRARDKYHNLENDEMVKSVFNLGMNKVGVDVPTTQSQLTMSTQGTHRTTSAPRTPNPDVAKGKSTTDEADDIILQYTIQLSLAEQKSHEEIENKQNEDKVKEHLMVEEIEKLVEGTENVEENEVDSSILRQNDNQNDTAGDDYELRRKEKEKHVEESRNTPSTTTIRSPRIHSTLISLDTEKLQELMVNDPPPSSSTPSSSTPKPKFSASQHILTLFMPRKKFHELSHHLQDVMEESLPKMVDTRVKELTKTQVPIYVAHGLIMERQQSQADVAKMIADAVQKERENLWANISSQINNAISNHIPFQVDSSVRNYMLGHILHVHLTQASPTFAQEQKYQLYLTMKDNPQLQQDDLPIWLALKYKFERLHVSDTPCRPSAVRTRDQDDPHDDAHPEGENSAKRQKTTEHGTYVFGESSSGQVNESEPGPASSDNQEQLDDFDFWTDSYATNDELPTEKVSQELVEEMSQTVDEAKLRKVKRNLSLTTSTKAHSSHSKLQRDPKAPALSPVNQDLLYLKKGKSGPEKIMMSLHKFHANPHAKIFYIKKQKEPVKSKEAVHSNSKIVQIIKTYWELGHEHKFITEIIARRAYGSIVDDYAETGLLWSLLVFIMSIMIWERVHDFQLGVESYQQKVNLTAPKITFSGIEKYKMFSIIFEPHGYVTPSDLSKEDAEYLQLFEEEIEERLKHRDQMRRWEILSKFEADFKQQQADFKLPSEHHAQMLYNWIMRRKLDPRKDTNRGVSNFTKRIKGMHIFVRNFTYVVDFMIVEDISLIIDPRLSQVVLGKPFVEISNMTHGLSLRVVKFTDGINEIAYKVPQKIEQYNSLSDLEIEHMKSVYLRNEEDKRRGG
ncbi:hypothetical protein Tco_0212009, partial [Tanacetum coccineum]